MPRRREIWIVMAALLLFASVYAWYTRTPAPVLITHFVHLEDVQSMLMRSGSTGEGAETDDASAFARLVSLFGDRLLTKSKNQARHVGYMYYVDVYHAKKSSCRIVFGIDSVLVNDVRYDLSVSLDAQAVIELFDSLKTQP